MASSKLSIAEWKKLLAETVQMHQHGEMLMLQSERLEALATEKIKEIEDATDAH